MASNNTASIAQARKLVEQLKMEANIDRIKVSKAAADLMSYCEAHAKEDPLLSPVPASENPFREKKFFCAILWTNMASSPPHNFSWVERGKVAGLALPRMTCEYQYLLDNGIKHLVCLCERKPPYYDTCPELQLHHIKIADFTSPSSSQIDRFLSIVEEANSKGEGVGVHCMHGHGRTGTMLACYLVKTKKISGIDAINEIRRLRRGSIETHEQEKAVVQFYQRTK
ncbi:hypothetical protein PAMP_005982 [Pampus punctatissimus]